MDAMISGQVESASLVASPSASSSSSSSSPSSASMSPPSYSSSSSSSSGNGSASSDNESSTSSDNTTKQGTIQSHTALRRTGSGQRQPGERGARRKVKSVTRLDLIHEDNPNNHYSQQYYNTQGGSSSSSRAQVVADYASRSQYRYYSYPEQSASSSQLLGAPGRPPRLSRSSTMDAIPTAQQYSRYYSQPQNNGTKVEGGLLGRGPESTSTRALLPLSEDNATAPAGQLRQSQAMGRTASDESTPLSPPTNYYYPHQPQSGSSLKAGATATADNTSTGTGITSLEEYGNSSSPTSPRAQERRHSLDILAQFVPSPQRPTPELGTKGARCGQTQSPTSTTGIISLESAAAQAASSSSSSATQSSNTNRKSRPRKSSLDSSTLLAQGGSGALLPMPSYSTQQPYLSTFSSPPSSAGATLPTSAGMAPSLSASMMQDQQSQQPPHRSPTRSRHSLVGANNPYAHQQVHSHSHSPHYETPKTNEIEAKVVILGSQGVGKTSMVYRCVHGIFNSSLPMTIGASFAFKKFVLDDTKVRLQIWDTAGQERFRSMAPMYYRGANAAILVYDITNASSLEDIRHWLDELRRNMSSELIIQIVGCKADLAAQREVSLQQAETQIRAWFPDCPVNGTTAALAGDIISRGSAIDGIGLDYQMEDEAGSRSRNGAFSGLSRSLSAKNQQAKELFYPRAEPEPELPAFKDVRIREVSAKQDEGVEDVFLHIAYELVHRMEEINNQRVLRTKDSIILRKEDPEAKAAGLGWGCC